MVVVINLFGRYPNQLSNGPHFAKIFIEYLIRSNVFISSTQHSALQSAVTLIDRALKELPATSSMSLVLPDEAGRACQAVWKDVEKIAGSPFSGYQTGTEQEEKEWEKEAKKLNMETIDPLKEDLPVPATVDEDVGGWGIPSGWGTAADAGNNTWGTEPVPDEENDADKWNVDMPDYSLTKYCAPGTEPVLVSTHRLGKIEHHNIRRVLDFYSPGDLPSSYGEGLDGLAVVILGPWKERPSESILEPKAKFFDENGKSISQESSEDGKKIRVLVDPSVMKAMLKGMLVGGMFVQLVAKPGFEEAAPPPAPSRNLTTATAKNEEDADAEMKDLRGPNDDQEEQGQKDISSTNSGEKKKKRKKKKNPVAAANVESDEIGYSYDIGADLEVAQGWWYFHQVLKVLPGYWAEEKAS